MTDAVYEDGLTPAVLEELIHECIARKDFEGVVACLEVLAVRAPERAELIHGVIKLGLAVGKARHEAAGTHIDGRSSDGA